MHLRMIVFHFWLGMVLLPWTIQAVPKVVVSIKPLHSMVSGVMTGIGNPELLSARSASVHAYAMRPSEASLLQEADLVFWIGPQLETFLETPLKSLPQGVVSVEMMETEGIQILQNDGKRSSFSTEDHGHFLDPHLWLDPLNAIWMVQRIRQVLEQLDSENASQYSQNSKSLELRLKRLDQDLKVGFQPLIEKPFVVFHPAYTYLEKRYRLNRVGVVMIHPERPTGARHLSKLRQMMQKNNVVCLFSEPQFEPRLVEMLIQGTRVRSGVLDPLGAELEGGPELYFKLLQNLGHSIRQCLDS